MSDPTWKEHLAWCKERALAYLPNDPQQAIASMASDLRKHSDGPSMDIIAAMTGIAMMNAKSPVAVREWIEGWN